MNGSASLRSYPAWSSPTTDQVPGTTPAATHATRSPSAARYTVVSLEDLSPGCGNLMPVMYGTIVPALAVFLLAADTIIIAVFMKPHIRSHTTYILTLIALADILNILCPTVIYIYYYTLGNYDSPIPYQMCWWTYMLGDVFHDMFNGISLWLTVLLAYIRCRCLKAPFEARCLHRCRNIVVLIIGILTLVLCVHIPSLFILKFHAVPRYDADTNSTVIVCGIGDIEPNGRQRKMHLWVELFLDSFLPSAILVYLDINILIVLRKAKQSRLSLRSNASVRRPNMLVKSMDPNNIQTDKGIEHAECLEHSENQYTNNICTHGNDAHCYQSFDVVHVTSCTGNDANAPKSPVYVTIELTDDLSKYCCVVNRTHTSKANTRRAKDRHRRSPPAGCCLSCLGEECTPPGHRNRGSQRSSDSAFDRLDRESRRTSWLILVVVTLITTHEIPYSLMNVVALIQHINSPLPLSKFGCWGPYLNLWQYIIYPLTFLIYACMSSVFRAELARVICCKWRETGDRGLPRVNNVFMSPCSVRKTLTRGDETTIHDSEDNVFDNVL